MSESVSILGFDDLAVGDRFELGEYVLTRDEIIDFAAEYDPQPYHLDDKGAKNHPVFTELCASGWHTLLILQRPMSAFWARTQLQPLAGAGVPDVKWFSPVYAHTRMLAEMTIDVVRRSSTNPDRAVITCRGLLTDAEGKPLTTLTVTSILAIT
jgi:acyl dehydratase